MWDYTDKVREHFLNPHNVGVIEDADGVGEVGSLACGDALTLYFKLGDDGRIKDAKFQTFGCASAIASSSVLTDLIIGKTLAEAKAITNKDIAEILGGLPPEKMHCSVMGEEALEAAIANYEGTPDPKKSGQVICKCFGVTDREIEHVVRDHNLKTVEDVTNYIKAGGACGQCKGDIEEIIAKVNKTITIMEAPPEAAPKKGLTILQKIKLIEETLEREVKPALEKDGGSIELVDVDGDRVYVRLTGMCAACARSQVTLKTYVETKLQEFVSSDIVVEEVR